MDVSGMARGDTPRELAWHAACGPRAKFLANSTLCRVFQQKSSTFVIRELRIHWLMGAFMPKQDTKRQLHVRFEGFPKNAPRKMSD